MEQILKERITGFIDFFYPPFKKYIPQQTFRYIACGGSNTLLDILIYSFTYNFILHKQVVYIMGYAISPYIMAFIIAFGITFPTGFFLQRTIVFNNSSLRGRVQLFRYFILVLICIGLNIVGIKFFVEILHFYPTIAKIATTIIVVCFSYFTQRYFTFKTGKQEEVVDQQ